MIDWVDDGWVGWMDYFLSDCQKLSTYFLYFHKDEISTTRTAFLSRREQYDDDHEQKEEKPPSAMSGG